MAKSTKYPRLRTHIRRGKSGQVYVYYACMQRLAQRGGPARLVA